MTAIVGQGAGELLTDEARRRVEVKADLDELAVTRSRYAEGESAPSKGFSEHLRGGDPDQFDTYDPSTRQEGS
jgi:hypothetical protein